MDPWSRIITDSLDPRRAGDEREEQRRADAARRFRAFESGLGMKSIDQQDS
jgi:hypothetical protein